LPRVLQVGSFNSKVNIIRGSPGSIEVPGSSKRDLVLAGANWQGTDLGKSCPKFGELLGILSNSTGVRKSKGAIERASMLSRLEIVDPLLILTSATLSFGTPDGRMAEVPAELTPLKLAKPVFIPNNSGQESFRQPPWSDKCGACDRCPFQSPFFLIATASINCWFTSKLEDI
jgi:hypothetical protein